MTAPLQSTSHTLYANNSMDTDSPPPIRKVGIQSYADILTSIEELLKGLKSRFDVPEGTALSKEIETHNTDSWHLISQKVALLAKGHLASYIFHQPFYNILANFLASDDLLDAYRARGFCNLLSSTRELYNDHIDAYLAHAYIKIGKEDVANDLITTPDLQIAMKSTRLYIDSRKALLLKDKSMT